MIGGLWRGLSGLSTHERAINNESNNATNVNTVGHKANDVRFEDLLYNSSGVGHGSAIQTINKNFVQGDLKVTTNDYDVAIEGKGYFIVNERGTNSTYYTRAGNFRMASDGLLETSDSLKVLGLTPQINQVVSSDPAQNQFSKEYSKFVASVSVGNNNFTQSINTKITDYLSTAVSSGESGNGYKSAGSKIRDIEELITNYRQKLDLYRSTSNNPAVSSTSQITTANYSSYLSGLQDTNDSLSITINNRQVTQKFEDTVENTLKKFADKVSNEKGILAKVDTTTGVLTIEGLVPGKDYTILDAGSNSKAATITNLQNASLGTGIGMVNSAREALKTAVELAGGKLMDITNTINLQNQGTLTVNEIQLKLSNLNLSENTFGKISFENDLIYLNDGDNKFLVGKLQTAFFKNDQGLEPQGNNLYQGSTLSGPAVYAGEVNKIHGKTLELSNAKVGDTLTNLLIYQKAFEANSKSITTSDEMLKTALALRK